jgi:hypothetical protein
MCISRTVPCSPSLRLCAHLACVCNCEQEQDAESVATTCSLPAEGPCARQRIYTTLTRREVRTLAYSGICRGRVDSAACTAHQHEMVDMVGASVCARELITAEAICL